MPDTILTVRGLRKAWGDKVLFDGLDFGIERGRKCAILGLNGCGKSTLLRILAGRESDFEGEVARRRDLAPRYLGQDTRLDGFDGRPLIEYMLADAGAAGAEIAAYHLASEGPERARLEARIADAHGWELYADAKALAGQLGLDLSAPLAPGLSGGQVKRAQLARALCGAPDPLLLDEPTNHLDEDGIRWLEGKLQGYRGTLVLVTHDRYFLERVVDEILELWRGQLRRFPGNYARYLEAKAELEERLAREDAKRLAFLRREVEWIRRGPKARGTKSKSRIQRYESARDTGGFGRDRALDLDLGGDERLGKTILEAEGVGKSLGGRSLVRDFGLSLRSGDRLGVLGPNGCGKTTLLRLLQGLEAPDAGTVRLGANTKVAYFDQKRQCLDPGKTVWETVGGEGEYVDLGGKPVSKRNFLEDFLFPPALQRVVVGRLSGGERARLQLAQALLTPANLLLLDEPTNDLDLASLAALEESLAAYPGCVLVVSHDRYFLDRVVTGLLIFGEGGRIRHFPGTYAEYEDWGREARPEAAPAEIPPPRRPAAPKPRTGLTWAEKRELEAMEAAILEAEATLRAAEDELQAASATGLFPRIQSAAQAHGQAQARVEGLYARWEALEAKAAGA